MAGNIDKDWAKKHIGTSDGRPIVDRAPVSKPAPARSLVRVALLLGVATIVLGGSGVVVADATGVYPIGLFPAHHETLDERPIVKPKPPESPRPETIKRPEPKAEERPVVSPVVEDQQPATRPIEAEAVAVDTRQARRNEERSTSLRRGITQLTKEKTETESGKAAAMAVLYVRPWPGNCGRTKPWSSAEVMEEIKEYVRSHPRISAQEKWDLQRNYDNAQADCTNATRRLQEIAEHLQSIQGRIDKAQSELDQIAAITTPTPSASPSRP